MYLKGAKFSRSNKKSRKSHFAGINFRGFALFWTSFFHFTQFFDKIGKKLYFVGSNFRGFDDKPRKKQKLVPLR